MKDITGTWGSGVDNMALKITDSKYGLQAVVGGSLDDTKETFTGKEGLSDSMENEAEVALSKISGVFEDPREGLQTTMGNVISDTLDTVEE
jgi:hypothetical protein